MDVRDGLGGCSGREKNLEIFAASKTTPGGASLGLTAPARKPRIGESMVRKFIEKDREGANGA